MKPFSDLMGWATAEAVKLLGWLESNPPENRLKRLEEIAESHDWTFSELCERLGYSKLGEIAMEHLDEYDIDFLQERASERGLW